MTWKARWGTSIRIQGEDDNMKTAREKIIEQKNRD